MAQTYMAVRNDRLSNSYQQRYVIIERKLEKSLMTQMVTDIRASKKPMQHMDGKREIPQKTLNEQKRNIKLNDG